MKTFKLSVFFLFLPGLFVAQETQPAATPSKITFPNTQATTRAVVIGIADYKEPVIPDLRFADKDAEALANFLFSPAGGSLAKEQVQILTNQKATAGNIIAALTWLVTDSKPGDRVIFSFSGHGDVEQVTKNQWGYLLAHDAPSKVYPAGGTVPLPYLQDIMATLSDAGIQVFIISDACHAGKLAGSARGGSKATTSALAQQYSNEIKLLSCQPDEFSLEGEQWGGGRGCFSFHLLNALTGAADANEDGALNLLEVGRYLEEKVSTDAAPQSQIPLSVGSRGTVLAQVNSAALAALQQAKPQTPMLSAGSMKGMEASILAGADTSLQELYRRFEMALENGNLLDSSGNSANDLYLRLIREPELSKLHGAMTRNLAAALQNEAQVVINQMLLTDPQILDDVFSPVSKYDHLPAWLARAAELLGTKHYMYRYLKAREYFFRSKSFRKEKHPGLSADSLLQQQLACIDTALSYDPEAAYLYFEKGSLQYWGMNNRPELYHANFEKAVELSPEWVLPVYFLGRAYSIDPKYFNTKGPELLHKAIELDSSFLPTYAVLGWYTFGEEKKRWQEMYVHRMKDFERSNPGRMPVIYLNYLGNTLWQLGKNEEAKAALLKGMEASKGQLIQLYANLGMVYCELGQYEEAEKSMLKLIELNPLASEGYIQLINNRLYFSKTKIETVPALFQKLAQAVRADQIYHFRDDLVKAYIHLGKLDSALLTAQDWYNQDTTNPQARRLLGEIQLKLGNEAAAKAVFQTLVNNKAYRSSCPPYYYHFIGRLQTEPWEDVKLYLEKLRSQPNSSAENSFWMACALAACNQPDAALDWFEKALQEGWKSPPLMSINPTLFNRDLDSIRNTKRFKNLAKKYLPENYKYMRMN
jgi:tetratricopeptide (TPR) repeat protein